MPIHEYECRGCGNTIELFNLSPVKAIYTDCVICGERTSHGRIISAPAVITINGFNESNGYAKKGSK
jgi:putative FmdB family regulatory protein